MNDPAFLFYPGDYLRDTQCLSEAVQVAYDRIMCEHMRNICISQQQLNFFTKKLSSDEIAELKMVLTEIEGGFQIRWVAESIVKRKAYSDSRRENRRKKEPKDMNNISKTYDKHMDNENENEIVNEDINKKEGVHEIEVDFDPVKPDGTISLNEIPDYEDFKEYAKEKESSVLESALKNKYDAWIENGWRDGNDKPIKNWKVKLLQTMPYIEKTKTNGKLTHNNR